MPSTQRIGPSRLSRRCGAATIRLTALVVGLCYAGAAGGEAPDSKPSVPVDRLVGRAVKDFLLQDPVSGKPVALYGFAGKKAAVLIFLGTDCPLAKVYAPRLAELNRDFRARGVAFLGIDSNAGDSDSAIREFAREHGVEFPIVKDRGNVVADQLMAERTPEVLVLDGRARIRYRGAIDDQYTRGARKPEPTRHFLKDAIESILAGRPVALSATDPPGCLIDRIEPKRVASSAPRIRPPAPELVRARREAEVGNEVHLGQVTFASDVARILQGKCQSCHRPGQVGPFSLLTYDDARKHAAMIGEVADNRRMPPWHADPRYGHFSNDRSLSGVERATLVAWAEQGAPLGDPKLVPPPKEFPEGWTIGKPDLVIEAPESFTVPAQGVVDYVRLRVPSGFAEDRWIQAAEAQPSDRSVVHHIIVYMNVTKGAKKGPGDLVHLCGYAPGDMPSVFPPGTAKKVPAGAELIFEIHYTPIGRIRTDRSRVGFIFAKQPVTREAATVGIAQGEFLIPPRKDNVAVSSSLTFDRDVRLLSFMPHMHLRGKDFKYTITRPGKAPEVVLSVPAYDFGWQSYYTLAEPLSLPKGTRVDCLAHFDNSEKNPYNPDPSKAVRWGDQTFEEMMIGYIDVDLPKGDSLNLGPLTGRRRRAILPSPGAIQAVAALLGFPPRLGGTSGAARNPTP